MTAGIRGLAAIGAVSALLVAGCGGDDEAESAATPEEVVTEFYAATGDGDAETMCSLITADAAETAAADEGQEDCVAGVQASIDGGDNEVVADIADSIEVGEATIDGETATVAISAQGSEDEVNLVQEDGEWKLGLE